MADTYTIRKALDLASTAAAYLLPEVVDGAIRDFVSKEPVIYNVVNKQPWATNTYWIRKRTALPTAEWRPQSARTRRSTPPPAWIWNASSRRRIGPR